MKNHIQTIEQEYNNLWNSYQQEQEVVMTQSNAIQTFKIKEKRVMMLLDELIQQGIDLDQVSDKLFNEDGSIKIQYIPESKTEEDMKDQKLLTLMQGILKSRQNERIIKERPDQNDSNIRYEYNLVEIPGDTQIADSSISRESKVSSFEFYGRQSSLDQTLLLAQNYQDKCDMKVFTKKQKHKFQIDLEIIKNEQMESSDT